MSKIVLDASVLLAVIHQEKGSDVLTPESLADAAVSTVNLTEVQSKLATSGWNPEEAWEDAISGVSEIVPFSAEHAKLAGSLIAQTRAIGLSLGDRACLALGDFARRTGLYSGPIVEVFEIARPHPRDPVTSRSSSLPV